MRKQDPKAKAPKPKPKPSGKRTVRPHHMSTLHLFARWA